MAITYVGGQVGGRAGATSTQSVTFALTEGSNSTPQAGDLVVITCIAATTNSRLPEQAISGYTALGKLYSFYEENSLDVSWKFMGETPDTTFTLPSTGHIDDSQRYTVQVFRGVHASPMDVTPTSASGVGTGRANPPAITPSTPGAWVLVCGGSRSLTGYDYVAPANFETNFLTGFTSDANDATVGSGYWTGWTSGEVDPAQYGGGSTAGGASWSAYTIALRPSSVDQLLSGDTSASATLSGSASITKPLVAAPAVSASTAGAVAVTKALLGDALLGVGTISGELAKTVVFSAEAAASAVATANLTTVTTLAGTTSVSAIASGDVTTILTLQSDTGASAELSGDLTKVALLSASATATAAALGDLYVLAASGTTNGYRLLWAPGGPTMVWEAGIAVDYEPAVAALKLLAGGMSATATAAGAISALRILQADSLATAVATGNLTRIAELTGSMSASGLATANLTANALFASNPVVSAAVQGSLAVTKNLGADMVTSVAAQANIALWKALEANAFVSAAATGDVYVFGLSVGGSDQYLLVPQDFNSISVMQQALIEVLQDAATVAP